MILFNCIFFAFISMVLGGLFTNSKGENAVPRYVSLTAVFVVLALQLYPDFKLLMAYCWLFWCIRLLPTQALFSAVHGRIPERKDWITKLVPSRVTGYNYGIVAGVIRTLPALPAIVTIGNPFLAVFFLIGFFYYIAGWVQRKYTPNNDNVRYVEFLICALFGLLIS